MPSINVPSGPQGKHIRAFWPLVIILVIAIIAGGLVYWYQFNLNTDYDLQSISLSVQRRHPTCAKNQVIKNGKCVTNLK